MLLSIRKEPYYDENEIENLRIHPCLLLLGTTPLSVVAQENYLGTDDDLSGYIVSDDSSV